MTKVLHLTFKRNDTRETIISDAQNADDWPDDELHEVVLDPGEITVEGTLKGMRWLYDYLEWAEDAYRLEDAKWDADECRDMADLVWEYLGPDPPERQRPRKSLR
jgi:hypothetical protein